MTGSAPHTWWLAVPVGSVSKYWITHVAQSLTSTHSLCSTSVFPLKYADRIRQQIPSVWLSLSGTAVRLPIAGPLSTAPLCKRPPVSLFHLVKQPSLSTSIVHGILDIAVLQPFISINLYCAFSLGKLQVPVSFVLEVSIPLLLIGSEFTTRRGWRTESEQGVIQSLYFHRSWKGVSRGI